MQTPADGKDIFGIKYIVIKLHNKVSIIWSCLQMYIYLFLPIIPCIRMELSWHGIGITFTLLLLLHYEKENWELAELRTYKQTWFVLHWTWQIKIVNKKLQVPYVTSLSDLKELKDLRLDNPWTVIRGKRDMKGSGRYEFEFWSLLLWGFNGNGNERLNRNILKNDTILGA